MVTPWASTPPQSINSSSKICWITAELKAGLSQHNFRNIEQRICQGGKTALHRQNPTDGVEFPRESKKTIPTLHYWTIPQAIAFLDATKLDRNKTWYYFFLIVLDLGLRKSEAMALTWGDINFAENTVDINKTRLYAAEKHEHAGEIILDDPKYPADALHD